MSLWLEGWQRPAWLLLALAIPLLYWWRSRSQRPPVVPTGSLELWRRVAAEERVGGSARRRRPPAWVLWLLAAWLAASVGVAEWRGRGRVLEPERWLIVDARAAAFGPAEAPSAGPADAGAPTRLERALLEVLERFDGDALWQVFDGRGVRSLRAADFPRYFEEQRRAGPADMPPDWSAWDRSDALWVAPSSADLPTPRNAGLHVLGGPELPGAVARDGDRWAWYAGGEVTWRPAPDRDLALARTAELPTWIAAFVSAYADAQGLALGNSDVAPVASLEWRKHRLPFAGTWVAEIDGARVAVEVAAGAAGDESPDAPGRWPGSHAEAGAVAPLLRVGPGWVSVAEGEWSLVSGDPAACALSLGRIADAQWRPEPGVLPVAARRALGPAARRDPRGAAWEGSGGRRRGAGRFTALAFALAAGAAWLAASRRG